MRRSGAHTFYIGLESAAPSTLAAMNKRQTVSEMRTHLARIRRAGVRARGMFVLGSDTDAPGTVAATVRFAIEERLSSAQFLILVPLPGTATCEKISREGRLVHRDWKLFDRHHVVFRPENFTARSRQWAQLAAHARFYSRRRELRWLSRFELKSAAICHCARRVGRAWRRENRSYMAGLEAARTVSGRPAPEQELAV